MDADFLAIYGIDLDDCDLTGPRFFALAHRLTAYSGVMAARVEEEKDDAPETETRSQEQEQEQEQPAGEPGRKEVSLTAFRVRFPGLVSVAQVGPEGG